jgi:hypothetical protein
MSTIATPRDLSVNSRRVPLVATPTGSSRPSLELTRSTDGSPSPAPTQPARRNRAALREYYNLQKNVSTSSAPLLNDSASFTSSIHDFSEVSESELDSPSFNAQVYVKSALETQSLGELLKTYNRVLTDIRALDAEKKALVYDNYSKLIAATETIGRMRMGMDPLNPMARTLDPAIGGIYERAEGIRGELRKMLGDEQRGEMKRDGEGGRRKVVLEVLEAPEKVRELVKDGREEEARALWEQTSAVLQRWKERGVGGEDVHSCIEDGEAALAGEPPNEKSWVNVKEKRGANS